MSRPGDGAPSSDFLPSEIGLAVLVAVLIQIAAGIALKMAALDKMAAAPEIDRGTAVPVKVIPVLDLDSPLLKLGGKKAKLPDAWKVKPKPVKQLDERSFVSTKAGKTAQDIPDKDLRLADAGMLPPPPDADVAKLPENPPEAVSAGPAPQAAAEEGFADGVKGGTVTDPQQRQAASVYRTRIVGWFQRRVHCPATGLPPEEVAKLHVAVSLQLSGLTVSGFNMSSSGNETVDSGVRAGLESLKGESLPPKPENFPDLAIPNPFPVTLQCK